MYIKNLALKNIGPINEAIIEFPFHQDKPVPIIFVGENGTGKTILISQIVDAIYEIANQLYNNVLPIEGIRYKYYKVSGGINLSSGSEQGFSLVTLIDGEKNKLEYFDKIGIVTKDEFTKLVPDFSLRPDDTNSNQKLISRLDDLKKQKLKQEFNSEPHFYQPAYRYEEPFWKNELNVDFENQVSSFFAEELAKEIEILTSAKKNKQYLLDLVIDFTINSNHQDAFKWNQINQLIRLILQRNDVRFGIGSRRSYRVTVVEQNNDGSVKKQLLPSIDNLSLGESILLYFFINIIRHSDNPPKNFEEIKGIVVIDEVDVHLHTTLQTEVFPSLIKLFPCVQFIFTTHSPLFLLGMKKILGEDNIELRSLPTGEIITSERFSEFQRAYEVFRATSKYETDLNEYVMTLSHPVIFVEGSYDVRYIHRAAELLEKKELLSQIKIHDANGYGGLDQIWKHYNTKLSEISPQKVLLLYDCDTNKTEDYKGKVIKKTVPFQNNNPIKEGIENLFPESLIQKAKKDNNECIDHTEEIKREIRGKSQTIPEKYEINKDEKGNLCKWICEKGSKNDFANFEIIFDIIHNSLIKK